MHTRSILLLILPSLGCSNNSGLVPCMGELDVGIFSPVASEQFPEGFPVSPAAKVNDPCGKDLSNAIITLASDIQEEVVVDSEWEDDTLTVTALDPLQPGSHALILKATGDGRADGKDEVATEIVENHPPRSRSSTRQRKASTSLWTRRRRSPPWSRTPRRPWRPLR